MPTACFTNQKNLKASFLMNFNVDSKWKKKQKHIRNISKKNNRQCNFGIILMHFDMFQLKYVFVQYTMYILRMESNSLFALC